MEETDKDPKRWVVEGLADRLREARAAWGRGRETPGGDEAKWRRYLDLTGIPKSSLYAYENGETQPKAWDVLRVSEVTGFSVEYLLRGEQFAARPKRPTPPTLVRRLLRELRVIGEDRIPDRKRRADYERHVRLAGKQIKRVLWDIGNYLKDIRHEIGFEELKEEEYRNQFKSEWGEDDDDEP